MRKAAPADAPCDRKNSAKLKRSYFSKKREGHVGDFTSPNSFSACPTYFSHSPANPSLRSCGVRSTGTCIRSTSTGLQLHSSSRNDGDVGQVRRIEGV